MLNSDLKQLTELSVHSCSEGAKCTRTPYVAHDLTSRFNLLKRVVFHFKCVVFPFGHCNNVTSSQVLKSPRFLRLAKAPVHFRRRLCSFQAFIRTK